MTEVGRLGLHKGSKDTEEKNQREDFSIHLSDRQRRNSTRKNRKTIIMYVITCCVYITTVRVKTEMILMLSQAAGE